MRENLELLYEEIRVVFEYYIDKMEKILEN